MNADPHSENLGHDARSGLRVSSASIAWTLAASAVEAGLGLRHHILTLVIFGAAGTLDAAGSAALVVHFRHAMRHDELADHHERRATLVVSWGLIFLGLLSAAESVRRLIDGGVGTKTDLGTAVAAASVIVLAVLATLKRNIGRRIRSAAMVADGTLSASGAMLALLAIVGATVGTRPRLRWADPAAALLIAVTAAVYGTTVLTRERKRNVDRR